MNQDPKLGHAVAAEDDIQIGEIIGERMEKLMEHDRKEMEKQNRLNNADPIDQATQKEIEEILRLNLFGGNFEVPEFFGSVTMLYIPAKVNGYNIQAFVDSGAQSTIISKRLAD